MLTDNIVEQIIYTFICSQLEDYNSTNCTTSPTQKLVLQPKTSVSTVCLPVCQNPTPVTMQVHCSHCDYVLDRPDQCLSHHLLTNQDFRELSTYGTFCRQYMVKAMAAPMATRMAMTIPAIAPSERPLSNVPSAIKKQQKNMNYNADLLLRGNSLM